jgi:hypothetical protein
MSQGAWDQPHIRGQLFLPKNQVSLELGKSLDNLEKALCGEHLTQMHGGEGGGEIERQKNA